MSIQKVYIMVDFEGVAGFIEWDDYSWDTPMGQEKRSRLRRILTCEVNAAIEGALAAGAKEVLVWDSHGPANNCNNIYFEDLNPEAEIIIGWKGLPSFYPLLNKSFDAGIYIGGHAMEGTSRAITPHTKHNLNGCNIGEVGMFIAMCGFFDIPVAFISGDKTTVERNLELVPKMGHVITKVAFSPYAAKTLIPKKAQQLIRQGVESALKRKNEIEPWKPESPYVFTLNDGSEIKDNNLWELFHKKISHMKFGTQEVQPQRDKHIKYQKEQLRYDYF